MKKFGMEESEFKVKCSTESEFVVNFQKNSEFIVNLWNGEFIEISRKG